MYCPHVCGQLANQGQVGILATRTFTLSTVTENAGGGGYFSINYTTPITHPITFYYHFPILHEANE